MHCIVQLAAIIEVTNKNFVFVLQQNDKIRMLANAVQVTKGVVAMKMQHEEKMVNELQNTFDWLFNYNII